MEVTLAAVQSDPQLGWNSLSVASGDEVVAVRYNGADGSYGNIAEVRLYRKC